MPQQRKAKAKQKHRKAKAIAKTIANQIERKAIAKQNQSDG